MQCRHTRFSSEGIRRVLINDRIARISSMQKNINPEIPIQACYFDNGRQTHRSMFAALIEQLWHTLSFGLHDLAPFHKHP